MKLKTVRRIMIISGCVLLALALVIAGVALVDREGAPAFVNAGLSALGVLLLAMGAFVLLYHKCPQCKHGLRLHERYCHHCGADLRNE